MKFKEFMNERALVTRWKVLKIAMIGAFAGSLLATMFLLLALVI